ncbi:MAG: BACON domain-containing protein [Anaerolineaceae bacterium]|jgi:hypothetical protein
MAGQPVAFVEWGNRTPANRYYQIAETGDGGYVPTVYVDSARLYAVGSNDHYNEYLGFINNSQARPPQATLTASYAMDGDNVAFTVTVTNNSNVTLSTANKAAVHGIVYEDYRAVKSDRIGRGSAKADITNLPPGATETYSFTVPISGVVDVSKLHFIALVDYKTTAKTNGIYDQLQATVAVPTGFVVSPSQLNFTFGALDPETPSGTVHVMGDAGQTWTASKDKDWLSLSPTSGNINTGFTVTLHRDKLIVGTQTATITVVDGTGEITRTVDVTVEITKPAFTVNPTVVNRNIYKGSAIPTERIVTSGQTGQTWTATANDPWLNVRTKTGNIGSPIQITYYENLLQPGMQTGTVTVRDGNNFHEITITFNVNYVTGQQPVIKLFMPVIMKP